MRTRPGFALVVSFMVIAGIAAIGAGMVVLGGREYQISSAAARASSARVAAESAVRAALASWSTRRYRELPVGTASPAEIFPMGDDDGPAAAEASWVVLRLDSALFLVEGAGRSPAAGTPRVRSAVARAGALVRTLDPRPLAWLFPAAATAVEFVGVAAGLVSGHGTCGPNAAAPAVLAPAVTVAASATVVGLPAVVIGDPPAITAPHPFTDPHAGELATITVESTWVSPRPMTTDGRCDADPLNWGAIASSNPCHTLLPFVLATGDLTVRGGEGRGLLLVTGDLHLDAVRFEGIILVRGRLTVGSGSTIRGAVRAHSIDVRDGSITYDACQSLHALGAGGLDRPFNHPDRLWIPLF